MTQHKTINADEETDDCTDDETDEDGDYVEDAESEDEDKDDDNDGDDNDEDTDDSDNEGDEDANGSKDGDRDEGEDGLKRGDDDDTEDGVGGKGDDDVNAGKDRDRDGDEKFAESEKNKDRGEDVAFGSQPEEENRGDNANKEEGHLKGSKEQQESQPPAPAQSTPTQEDKAVRDYPFLARHATPSIPEDVPTFNLGFDSTQETVEEREADEATAKKALEDTTPVPHEYNKREWIEVIHNKKEVYLLNNQLDKNDIKSIFSKSDDRLDHKELEGIQFFHVEVPRAVGWQENATVRSKGHF
ncbi:hypothetical protein E2562_003282 [Oryza meyeriana var. granulata]|uniref:Uncharacterized protein n=1 Tax=Oryza meyeriana var. granulata TaxID=110450 RepID=A0A6G1EE42_9ORYZ|nr:hypothetical protein E2562_003282 [Oryza meyeriana var. granulata]